MEPLSWVKVHQKEIIERIISDANLAPNGKPTAIFMAGLPGAGKTELSLGLIDQSSPMPIRIDMDELATMIDGYTPERADEFREGATKLLNALLDKVIKLRLDFVLDGTFGSPNALRNVERVLKRGYSVQVAYACQDPRLAWRFTLAREKVEHRAISEEGFIETYYKILANLRQLSERKYDDVMLNIFVKDEKNYIGTTYIGASPMIVDDLTKTIYNKDKLKQYIES